MTLPRSFTSLSLLISTDLILVPPSISVPLHSDRNPFDEPGPVPPPNDLLAKAQGFGMKVWELESEYCLSSLSKRLSETVLT